MSTSTPEASGRPSGAWMQQGLLTVPFRKELHNAELLLLVSIECCTDVTVILYYLAHCRDVI